MPKTEAEWKEMLAREQYEVLRKKGTEAPFTGSLLKRKKGNVYMLCMPNGCFFRGKNLNPEQDGPLLPTFSGSVKYVLSSHGMKHWGGLLKVRVRTWDTYLTATCLAESQGGWPSRERRKRALHQLCLSGVGSPGVNPSLLVYFSYVYKSS